MNDGVGSARATASPTAAASRPSTTTGSAPRFRSSSSLSGVGRRGDVVPAVDELRHEPPPDRPGRSCEKDAHFGSFTLGVLPTPKTGWGSSL